MKTNFEVWRDQLTPEMLYEAQTDDCVCTFPARSGLCPAWEYCKDSEICGCKETFMAWASATAEEDE